MTKNVIKLKPEEWYTMQDIVTGKMFPWANTFWSVRKIVEGDKKNKDILKGIITGDGRGTKYRFKGANIIKFVKAVEAGKAKLS